MSGPVTRDTSSDEPAATDTLPWAIGRANVTRHNYNEPVILLLQQKQPAVTQRSVRWFWLLGNPGDLRAVRNHPWEALALIQHLWLHVHLRLMAGRRGANEAKATHELCGSAWVTFLLSRCLPRVRNDCDTKRKCLAHGVHDSVLHWLSECN
jgi:hypothetical protein